MKRTLFIEISLIIITIVLIVISIDYWSSAIYWLHYYNKELSAYMKWQEFIESHKININKLLSLSILTICGTISTLTAIILIAIKDFPAFQPLRDKLAARKEARKEVKAQKAEANKQARIEALQNELDQLKKDE